MGDIGSKIKQLRLQKELTLKQVSEKTGLSIGFLSQVERSKSSATLQSISKISEALNVSRSYFFDDEEDLTKNDSVEENSFKFHNTTFVYQGLSGDIKDPRFEPMLVVLLPTSEKVTASTHHGQEFVYVLEGELTVLIGDNKKTVSEGGSFHIDSSTTPHTWYNDTKTPVKLIYVYSRN